MAEITYQVKELDLELINPNSKNYLNPEQGGHKLVIIGAPGTGKSTVIMSIIYEKSQFIPVATILNGTEDSNHAYAKSVFPSIFVANEYNEEMVTSFIKRQKLAKEHLENPWALIVIDDCTDNPAIFRKPLQQGMYKRGRHWKMLYLLSLQYSIDLASSVRTNVDGVFIMREPILKMRKSLYENYAGIIPDFKLFCDLLDSITDDYTALYIHKDVRSNNWQDCVYWYKAKPPPEDFKFGCDTYWDHHYQRFNPEYVDPLDV